MRYVTRATEPAKSDDDLWWSPPMLPSLNVDGGKEVDTGLFDRHGHKIMRLQAPIGFGRDDEH